MGIFFIFWFDHLSYLPIQRNMLYDRFTYVLRTHCHCHHHQGSYSHVLLLAALVATLPLAMKHPSSLKQDQGPIWARTQMQIHIFHTRKIAYISTFLFTYMPTQQSKDKVR
jgi:hypothetical protein